MKNPMSNVGFTRIYETAFEWNLLKNLTSLVNILEILNFPFNAYQTFRLLKNICPVNFRIKSLKYRLSSLGHPCREASTEVFVTLSLSVRSSVCLGHCWNVFGISAIIRKRQKIHCLCYVKKNSEMVSRLCGLTLIALGCKSYGRPWGGADLPHN